MSMIPSLSANVSSSSSADNHSINVLAADPQNGSLLQLARTIQTFNNTGNPANGGVPFYEPDTSGIPQTITREVVSWIPLAVIAVIAIVVVAKLRV